MDKIYVVEYSRGSYDDYCETILFATTNKAKAKKYVSKFNTILEKWKGHYEIFEGNKFGMKWLKDEHIHKFDRWNCLRMINRCYWYDVPVR